MATGFDIFGETVRDWLEVTDNDEAEPESLVLAASDDYESSQDPAQQPNARAQQINTASHSHSQDHTQIKKTMTQMERLYPNL